MRAIGGQSKIGTRIVLRSPLTEATTVVLVRPHYPENVGAAARAAKTMGITRLCLVKPGRLAVPEHEMAFKMGVRAWDVLGAARRCASLESALEGVDLVLATTGRSLSGALNPRTAAQMAARMAHRGGRIAVLFGNEKTGLASEELDRATHTIRIPMAASQPSINLAQAVQLVAYEWFCAATQSVSG